MITVDDVVAAERARCAATVAGDVAGLDAVLGEELRYGHTSGTQDTKRSYLDKIADGRLVYPELTSTITDSAVVGGVVLCWLTVDGRVVLPAGAKTFHATTLTVWAGDDGRPRLVALHPTVVPAPTGPPRPSPTHPPRDVSTP